MSGINIPAIPNTVDPAVRQAIAELKNRMGELQAATTGATPSTVSSQEIIRLIRFVLSSGNYITGLTGDVVAVGPGIAAATVISGTTLVAGKLQLTDSIASTSITTAATPNSVKTAYDLANSRAVSGHDQSVTLASGTYTPTLTNVANLGASTAYECQYLRVGGVVAVSGRVDIDPTLTATATQLGISLPIASNLAADSDCAGTAFSTAIPGQGAGIHADTTNDRAEMAWKAGDVTNQNMYFTFIYEVK